MGIATAMGIAANDCAKSGVGGESARAEWLLAGREIGAGAGVKAFCIKMGDVRCDCWLFCVLGAREPGSGSPSMRAGLWLLLCCACSGGVGGASAAARELGG